MDVNELEFIVNISEFYEGNCLTESMRKFLVLLEGLKEHVFNPEKFNGAFEDRINVKNLDIIIDKINKCFKHNLEKEKYIKFAKDKFIADKKITDTYVNLGIKPSGKSIHLTLDEIKTLHEIIEFCESSTWNKPLSEVFYEDFIYDFIKNSSRMKDLIYKRVGIKIIHL